MFLYFYCDVLHWQCVVEAGKQVGVGFLDLFGQALCPPQPSSPVFSSGWHGLSTKLR